jgi:hypothetical protein
VVATVTCSRMTFSSQTDMPHARRGSIEGRWSRQCNLLKSHLAPDRSGGKSSGTETAHSEFDCSKPGTAGRNLTGR